MRRGLLIPIVLLACVAISPASATKAGGEVKTSGFGAGRFAVEGPDGMRDVVLINYVLPSGEGKLVIRMCEFKTGVEFFAPRTECIDYEKGLVPGEFTMSQSRTTTFVETTVPGLGDVYVRISGTNWAPIEHGCYHQEMRTTWEVVEPLSLEPITGSVGPAKAMEGTKLGPWSLSASGCGSFGKSPTISYALL